MASKEKSCVVAGFAIQAVQPGWQSEATLTNVERQC
jgi:hypothetical protein